MKYEEFINDREIHEECGVFGIYNVPNAAEITYYALHSLQHRGQEGCGIVACDENKRFTRKKGPGLVTEVFKDSNLKDLAPDGRSDIIFASQARVANITRR